MIGGRGHRRDLVLTLLLGALLYLPGLGARDLWNPDEPRYAEVAREMLEGGTLESFLVPHLNGEVYSQKPPLLFWLMCLGAAVSGKLSETVVRLPLALSALLTLPVLFDLARAWLSRRGAWLAVAVFGTCINLMLQARSAQIDMLLVLLVCLAMRSWVRWLDTGRRGHALAGFAFAGLATLAKGPVGLLPPILSLAVFLVVAGERRRLRELGLGAGLLVWAAVVGSWLAPAVVLGGEPYARSILFQQNLERYAVPTGHLQPWYYYLAVLPVTFVPWSVLLPTAVLLGWRWTRGPERRAFLFAISWIVTTILFFSLSPGKRTVYVLTMYPALALAIACAVDELARRATAARRWLGLPLALLAALAGALTIGALVLPRFASRWPEIDVLGPDLPWRAFLTTAALALGAWIALGLAAARRPIGAVVALAAGSGVAGLVLALVLLPPFDAVKSARGLARAYLDRASPDEPYAIFPRLDPPFLFYTGRRATVLRSSDDLRAFAARHERGWIFAEERFLRALDPQPDLIEIARDSDPRSGYVLLVTRPLAPAPD